MYSLTTWLPGANEVLTHGLDVMPRAAALRASKPAAIKTEGLEVLVQEVMAAITTSPWPRSKFLFSTFTRLACSPILAKPALSFGASRADWKPDFMPSNGTNFSGRLGPAMAGTTEARSSSKVSVNSGSVLLANMPCALQYFLTSAMRSFLRPESLR